MIKKIITVIVYILTIVGALAFLYFGISGEGYQFVGGIWGRVINIVLGISGLLNLAFNGFKL